MKNQVTRSMGILGLFFMLAIATAQAQTPGRVEVNIPFDFAAGKATFKAGVYNISRRTGNVLAIGTSDGKTTALVNAPLTIGSRDYKAGERLVFNQYGDRYFLSQIWMTAETGKQLFTSRLEKRLAQKDKFAKRP